METILFSHKQLDENGRIADFREVKAALTSDNELVIHRCDINKTAKASFGDSGVEFYLTIDHRNRRKLQKQLGLSRFRSGRSELLGKISEKFGGAEDCFEQIMAFLKSHNIHYTYDRW